MSEPRVPPLQRHSLRRKIARWRGWTLAITVASCTTSQVREPPRGADLEPVAHAQRVSGADARRFAETQKPAKAPRAARDATRVTSTTEATQASAVAAPKACAEGMELVEGEHCAEVEQRCEKSWYDPNN